MAIMENGASVQHCLLKVRVRIIIHMEYFMIIMGRDANVLRRLPAIPVPWAMMEKGALVQNYLLKALVLLVMWMHRFRILLRRIE